MSGWLRYWVKPILKFSISKLESVFISCEFNIPGVIAFYAFLRQLKKNPSAIHLSGLRQMFRTFVLRCDWSILRILKSTKLMTGLWQMFRTFVLRCDCSILRILKSTKLMTGLWQMFRTFVLRCDWSILRILKSTKKHDWSVANV